MTRDQIDLWCFLAGKQIERRAKATAFETAEAFVPIFKAIFGGA
jgi:hypothetical protein